MVWSKQPHPLQPNRKVLLPLHSTSHPSGSNALALGGAAPAAGSLTSMFHCGQGVGITDSCGAEGAAGSELTSTQREGIYLHEFEELKMRLAFPLAAFVPIHLLVETFPSPSAPSPQLPSTTPPTGLTVPATAAATGVTASSSSYSRPTGEDLPSTASALTSSPADVLASAATVRVASSSAFIRHQSPFIRASPTALRMVALRLVASEPSIASWVGVNLDSEEVQKLTGGDNQLEALLLLDTRYSLIDRDRERSRERVHGMSFADDDTVDDEGLEGRRESNERRQSARLSDDFGAAGMMDEDLPFAFAPSLADPQEEDDRLYGRRGAEGSTAASLPHGAMTPNTKRRSSLSTALEGTMLTSYFPVSPHYTSIFPCHTL